MDHAGIEVEIKSVRQGHDDRREDYGQGHTDQDGADYVEQVSQAPSAFLQQRYRKESHRCAPAPINPINGIKGPTGMYS
jgi:hypothetical protein